MLLHSNDSSQGVRLLLVGIKAEMYDALEVSVFMLLSNCFSFFKKIPHVITAKQKSIFDRHRQRVLMCRHFPFSSTAFFKM